MNDEVHKDDDDLERPNMHNKSNGGNDNNDANLDHVHCLSSIFPTQTTTQWSIFTPLIELFLR
jgi:hypothetical protein